MRQICLTSRFFPFFTFAVLLVACTAGKSDSEELLPDLEISNTLSNMRISSIAEDSCGYIWMSTSRGLNRYNGDNMHQYFCNDEPNSIPDNRINNVFCDSKGSIWITSKNGVARHTDKDDFESIPVVGSTLRCQKMAENSRGDLFVQQTNCILKYDPESNCFRKAIEGISYIDPYYQDVLIDEEDYLWVIDDRSVVSYSTTTLNKRETLDLGDNPEIQAVALVGSHLWIGLTEGLRIYDVLQHQWIEVPEVILTHPLYNCSRLRTIAWISHRFVMLSSADGIFLYNPATGHFYHQSHPQFPFAPPSHPVNFALADKQGNLWLCSDSQGYSVRHPQNARSKANTTFSNALVGNPVVSVVFEEPSTLWVATEDNGLFSYDIKSEEILHFDKNSVLPAPTKSSQLVNLRIYCVYIDQQGDIWIATSPRGLVQMHKRGNKLEFLHYYNLPNVIVLKEDKEGTLWVGCYGNSYYSKRRGDTQFLEHHLFSNTFSYMSCMELLRDGSFATLVREQGLRYINPETQEQMAPAIPDSVLNSCIARSIFLPSAMKEDAEGRLWIGTVSNGLLCYDPRTQSLEHCKGAPCEDIASIEIDNHGNIWVSTQYGLGKYNVQTHSFSNYYSADGLGGNEYFDRASCQLPDGTLFFGGPHGLTVFNPLNLVEVPVLGIRLEDLRVHNRLIRPSADAPIQKHLSKSDVVNLKYDQNTFSLSFSALDFCEDERYNYQYMLEGFDRTWVDAGNNREAFYANLRPDQYTFHVQITNKDRDQVLAETSIPVIVHPSVWGTWWAKLLYVLTAMLIVFYIGRLYLRIRQEKKNRLRSQREKEQEHRINQMNMNFFANVSHEFRTPLTVISGPISQLCQDSAVPGEQQRLLKVVNRSVTRMLQLVNQMMDFHKLEDDTLKLEVKRQDVVGFMRNVAEFFAVNAHDKNIDFRTHGLEDVFLMWTDLDKLEKILNNLLGNAMKYTPAGGRVDLSLDVISCQEAQQLFPGKTLSTEVQYAKIAVSDNGPGIPAEHREKVFDRYYQFRNKPNQSFNWGTGIGLYYANQLVHLHHGQIAIFDNPEGEGTNFCFILPVGREAYDESEIVTNVESQASLFPLQNEIENVQEASDISDKPHIVVVDDDVDVIHYLKLLLGKDYRVTCRFDATTALETLRKQDEEIDLVISDVMMPGTSGFQLCQQIKADDQLCHLPVILVTAKNTVRDQVEGLQSGAMAYVTKPFDPAYLQALIHRLLDTRDQTRKVLQVSTQTPDLEENVLSAQDTAFMTELYRLMEEELSNPDMDVTRLTDLLHVSRSKLYYKIKGLTGENPSVFFKTYKLNRAAEMIREGKYNISEISLLTGFSTLSHFSTSFKKQFGVAPSDY